MNPICGSDRVRQWYPWGDWRSGDTMGCHSWGRGTSGTWWVEVKGAAKQPTTHRRALTMQDGPAPCLSTGSEST